MFLSELNQQNVTLANGESLSTIDVGTGEVVLLVHGFPLSNAMWLDLIPGLSKYFRVLAPDLRGFGRSPMNNQVFSMGDLATDLSCLLDALAIHSSINLVGLSMGGYISFEFWERFPQRLKRLVLCDTKAIADTPTIAASRLATAERAIEIGTKASTESMVPRLMGKQALSNEPDKVQRLTDMMYATKPETIASAQRAMASRQSFAEKLTEIQIPTYILVGKEDPISTEAEMSEMASAINGSQFHVIPDCGHMPPMEKPEAFEKALLDFLRS